MTGYGEAERPFGGQLLRAEIKTVNHRFFNPTIRTPPGFDRIEQEIQRWLRPFVSRGHVQLVISLDRSASGEVPADDLPVLDLERARRFADLLRRLRDEVGLEGAVDVASVLRVGDVLVHPEAQDAGRVVDGEVVRELVEEAARGMVAMREAEGRRLQIDLESGLDAIVRELDRIEGLAPDRLLRERDRLRALVRELAEQEDVDEERLAREIAYLAEKWDINEEVVRFRSHVALFLETLAAEGAEPVGKRLSFVVQEMHREANTIGAKANDAEIVRSSVALKEEIERLREQVENVE
jgi:uncharacterized protein (TIGR00255 family)